MSGFQLKETSTLTGINCAYVLQLIILTSHNSISNCFAWPWYQKKHPMATQVILFILSHHCIFPHLLLNRNFAVLQGILNAGFSSSKSSSARCLNTFHQWLSQRQAGSVISRIDWVYDVWNMKEKDKVTNLVSETLCGDRQEQANIICYTISSSLFNHTGKLRLIGF